MSANPKAHVVPPMAGDDQEPVYDQRHAPLRLMLSAMATPASFWIRLEAEPLIPLMPPRVRPTMAGELKRKLDAEQKG
jgi:hypothetical protein